MNNFQQLLEIDASVSRETYELLQSVASLVTHWNTAINLVAPSTIRNLWQRHILDSVQLSTIAPLNAQWMDIGSGGGLPGLPIGALMHSTNQGMIHLVESNRKKAGFLQMVVGTFHLPAQVHAERVEEVDVSGVKFVTARAVASLEDLLGLSERFMSSGATGLFHKGKNYHREIEIALSSWRFSLVEHHSKVDPEGVILEIKNLRRRRRDSAQK